MTRRYGLRDDQWARIEALLPGRAEHEDPRHGGRAGQLDSFHLTGGQAQDLARALIADRSYDAEARVLTPPREAHTGAVIPPKRNRKEQRVRCGSVPGAAPGRELLLPAQAVPRHRHTLRQDGRNFPAAVYLAATISLRN